MTDADRQSVVRPDVYSGLSTTSYEYSSLSVDSLSTSVARIKVSLDSHVLMMLMHATGGHGELNLIPLASTVSYQDVGAETVSFAACPTPAQLPHGLQFAAAVDLPALLPDIHRRR